MKLKKLYEEVTKEIGFLVFHGSPTEFTKFSDEFVGGREAVEHDGPGIYFTTNFEDATYYGKNIYTAKIRGNFIFDSSPSTDANLNDVEKLLRMSEEWELTANNWSEDPETGLQLAMKDFVQYNTNEKDVFLQVWFDFYRNDTLDWVRNMVKLGYDGVVCDTDNPKIKHIIVYNPNIITMVDKEIVGEGLAYRHANTTGPEDDEYEVGMVTEGSAPIIAYHGTKTKINTFTDEFVGGKEATDQEGPGIYFTTKAEEALRYASPNGFVYKVELTPRKRLSSKMGFDFDYLTGPVTKLIKMLPNWKAIANSYDEGLEELVYMMTSMGQSEKEVFVNLYYQYFRENAKLFVRGMVKLGYDALYLPSRDGGAHIAVYNPNIINVVDVKQL